MPAESQKQTAPVFQLQSAAVSRLQSVPAFPPPSAAVSRPLSPVRTALFRQLSDFVPVPVFPPPRMPQALPGIPSLPIA